MDGRREVERVGSRSGRRRCSPAASASAEVADSSSVPVAKHPGPDPATPGPRLACTHTATRGAFGIYVHVPFCAARCGYCDFNTYTASELAGSGASPEGWLAAVRQELDLAVRTVGRRPVDTVFVGGGTPSLLGAARLGEVLG